MVTSRALPNNTHSPYFTPYTFISLILPCGLLSLINTLFEKSMSADCFGNDMSSRLNIQVIKFPFESLLRFPDLLFRKQVRDSKKGVMNFTPKR